MSLTRLAPSPTGALHLGNARTFLINWLLARQSGWRILLRIEDLDGPRIKRGADQLVTDDLRWLGLLWDDGPVYQSARAPHYHRAIEKLLKSGDAYPCVCTRREVALAASAPHADDSPGVYPGTCRGRFDSIAAAREFADREPSIRFRVPDGVVKFIDTFAGEQRFDVARDLGDFVIAKSERVPAYQLAVVVDDADGGVNQVVRGDDLLDSTPRQMLLYRALGLDQQIPQYTHVPLVVGPDGKRLAKRHGDTRLATYRVQGIRPGRVLARLARWIGIDSRGESISLEEMIRWFDLRKLSREKVIVTPDLDAGLPSTPQ